MAYTSHSTTMCRGCNCERDNVLTVPYKSEKTRCTGVNCAIPPSNLGISKEKLPFKLKDLWVSIVQILGFFDSLNAARRLIA
jgi:hypothetical protein